MLPLDTLNQTFPPHGQGHSDALLGIVLIVIVAIGLVAGVAAVLSARRDGYGRLPERTAREAEKLDRMLRR